MLLELIKFEDAKTAGFHYGGDAGIKYGIIFDDEVWMVKYPKTTRDMRNPQISYTTSPLSEYIGSKIYETLGTPVHETLLGTRKSKIVVACKDFLAESRQPLDGITSLVAAKLIPFHDLKNSFMASDFDAYSGSGSETLLNEVLDTLYGQDDLKHMPEAVKRFWDMFVIDAFIGNNDRHNNNWGLIFSYNKGIMELAPVYDNGNAFYNKRSIAQMQKRMDDPVAMKEDALISIRSAFKYKGLDNEGHKINPFEFMQEASNSDCSEAVLRFATKVDICKIENIINEIPETFGVLSVMPKVQKDFYKQLLRIRLDYLLELAEKFKD